MTKRVHHSSSSGTSKINMEQFSYVWTLENTESFYNIFRNSSTSYGQKLIINSEYFNAGEKVGKPCKWYMSLGVSFKKDTEEFISLHLGLKKILWNEDENPDGRFVKVAFRLQLISTCGKVIDCGDSGIVNYGFAHQNATSRKLTTCWGWDDFCTFSEMVEFHDQGFLSKNKLIFKAEIDIFGTPKSLKRALLGLPPQIECTIDPNASLTEMYLKLFESGNGSDVTIITEDKSFHVHKLILSVNSPVFAAMLSVDMKEKESSTITLETFNSAIVYILLKYMYTHDVSLDLQKSTMDSTFELMSAANMYQIDNLKEDCFRGLLSLINIDNAARIAVWAYLYMPQQETFEEIQEFYLRNLKSITLTPVFKKLFQENPQPFNVLVYGMEK